MKNTLKKIIAILIVIIISASFCTISFAAEKDVIVLYTNDVHCNIDGYAKLAAYKAELISQGHEVVLVDVGDAIQGEVIGTLTQGSALVDIMNTVDYDYATLGNHEFDYSMDTLIELVTNEAQYKYICANLVDLKTNQTVFEPYDIIELGGQKVAFIGIATPESYTKSTPVYFQDEDGNYIYSFSENTLNTFYNTIQNSVDAAKTAGADIIIAMGHLGIDGTTEGWKSTDVITNTTGIDVFLDAHSHEKITSQLVDNRDGNEVLLSSTETKLKYIGQLNIKKDGTKTTQLIELSTVDVDSMSNEAKEAYNTVDNKVQGYNAQIEYLFEIIGKSEVELTLNNPDNTDWVIRKSETNMGDFVADAYRTFTGADIAIANGGGIRASIPAGDVTRKQLMDVNPWNNEMCVIKATGSQILDALEHGASLLPETSGGFLQVSGMSYEIEVWKESPVIKDTMGNFIKVDATKERRVTNVKIAGKPIDPNGTYTIAGSYYTLKQGGDGFAMFKNCEVVQKKGLPTDADMLINYVMENLGGTITSALYGNLAGDGRITIRNEEIPETGDNTNIVVWTSAAALSLAIVTISLMNSKKKKVK